ncbi:MAG: PIN domain nuclease [Candidatus Competibacteraceae bacterium]|nr:PIN domain nuclease [Candidatus Competibacteraceae bacterium]
MILVDSSVWIAYFNGMATPQTDKLDDLLSQEPVGLGDLILTEVLQGFRFEKDYKTAKKLLTSLTICELLGESMAIKSADNFRLLRRQGITIRKTVDVIIATFCIENNFPLLHADRDFKLFCTHLNLRSVI